MTAEGHGVSFWGDDNILKLDGGDGCSTLEILKTSDLYRLKRPGRAHGFYLQKAVIKKTHTTGPGVEFPIGAELPGRQGTRGGVKADLL